jgi:hypothetical protein
MHAATSALENSVRVVVLTEVCPCAILSSIEQTRDIYYLITTTTTTTITTTTTRFAIDVIYKETKPCFNKK